MNWRTHLKFPEEARISPEATDLISKLLCNVNQRLGLNGADEIKVSYDMSISWLYKRCKILLRYINLSHLGSSLV